MTRILGIDPGSRTTGFGIVDFNGSAATCVTCGCIHARGATLAERLRVIYQDVSELVSMHRPEEMAAEQVFVHRNASSALKLGQARGVALLAGVMQGVPVYEYSPNLIKQAVTGKGHAAKEQVQHMIRVLLQLAELPAADAADALAVALCHGHTRSTLGALAAASGARETGGAAR